MSLAWRISRAGGIEGRRGRIRAGVAAGLLLVTAAGVVGFFWMRRATSAAAAPAGRVALTAEQRGWADDAGEAERRYEAMRAAGEGGDAAIALLEQAMHVERRLLRANPQAGVEHELRLERFERARDTERARSLHPRIGELESAGDAAWRAGRSEAAVAAWREARSAQQQIDASQAEARFKNRARELSLAQRIETAEAAPVVAALSAALERAQAAVAETRWPAARTAYEEARELQRTLDRDFPRTAHANPRALAAIDDELASLQAAAGAAEIETLERAAEAAADAGRTFAAAEGFQAALARQRTLNSEFARSRFASAARADALEVKRQAALAKERLVAVAQLEQAIAASLRRREVWSAQRQLGQARALVAELEAECARAPGVEALPKDRFAYLASRETTLRNLQDELYDRLLPVPEVDGWLMLKSEVPQSLYAAVMTDNPSRQVGSRRPVDSVNWHDAEEFCRRASWLLGTQVRLPTEEEYRAAVELGDTVVSETSAEKSGVSPVIESASSDPVFLDLTGNVAEWLHAENGVATATVAGGSYLDAADDPEEVRLMTLDRNERARHIGFRVVVALALE